MPTNRLTNGFEGMTFPNDTGPDGGWSLAHNGSGTFSGMTNFSASGGDNHAGSISLDVEATNIIYGVFRSVTALRQSRLKFYFGIYNNSIVDSDMIWEVQIDDGSSAQIKTLQGSNGTLPANGISIVISATREGSNIELTFTFWYRHSSQSVTSIGDDFVYEFTPTDSTTYWIGVKAIITDSYIELYLDKTNQGIFSKFKTIEWTSPFSGTPFNKVRVTCDDGSSLDHSGLDSLIIDSIVLTSSEITSKLMPDSIIATRTTRGGGTLTFKYKDKWLADKSTVDALLNANLSVTNKDTVPFSKYIITEIEPHIHNYTFKCHQDARELDYIPANHNPITNQGVVEEITQYASAWKLYDRDAEFGDLTTEIHYLSFGKTNKKVTRMEPTTYLVVENTDLSTPFVPEDTLTPVAVTKEGTVQTTLHWQDDGVVNVANNMIGAYEYSNSVGDVAAFGNIISNEIHIKENATLLRAVLKIDFWHSGLSEVGGVQPEVLIYDYTNTVWVSLQTFDPDDYVITRAIEPSGALSVNMWMISQNVEYNIGTEISDYLDPTGAVNDQGFQKFDIKIAIRSGRFNWLGTDNFGQGNYCKYIDLEIDQTEDSFLTEGIGKVASNTTTIITLNNNFDPGPAQDGVIRGDNYFITEGRPNILDDIWVASGADALFVIDNGLSAEKGDGVDYTLIFTSFVLNKYADLEGLQWWQDNDPDDDYIRIKTPEDSGLVFTENNILGYIKEGTHIRGTTKYMRNKIRVAGSYNSFHEETLNPAKNNSRIELYEKPELVTSQQCKDYAQAKIAYHEDIQYQGNVPYIWTGDLLNLEIGHTVGLKIDDGSKHDYTDATGSGNLFVKSQTIIQVGNQIRANATLTSYFTSIEE